MTDPHADPATLVVTLGRPPKEPGAPLNPPVELSTTFVGGGSTASGQPVYGRTDNTTWQALETVVGTLEGSPAGCVVFGSGMAAVTAVLDTLPLGSLLLVPPSAYNTTLELAQHRAASGQLRIAIVDPSDRGAVEAALEPGAMLWIESPSNPLLDVADIAALCAAARQAGARTVVDNTFATPLHQRPLESGADIVIHSATKYLAGHSDLLLGAVVVRDEGLRADLVTTRRLTGAIPGSFETWLALRGLRTLAVRFDRAQTTARDLAGRLSQHRAVSRVRYPGFGAMISIEVLPATAVNADRVIAALQLWTAATSLGGVESLAERRRRHANEPATVPDHLIRLSVGIEHVEDLWADLDQALTRSFAVGEFSE